MNHLAFLQNLGPTEWIIIGLVVILVFGASRIPQIARSLGRSSSEFKKGLREGREKDAEENEEEKAKQQSEQSSENTK